MLLFLLLLLLLLLLFRWVLQPQVCGMLTPSSLSEASALCLSLTHSLGRLLALHRLNRFHPSYTLAQAKRTKDVNILIFQREVHLQGANKDGPQKIRHQVQDRRGEVKFKTGNSDGLVDICIQSYMATYRDPSRIELNITSIPTSKDEGRLRMMRSARNISAEIKEAQLTKTHSGVIANELLGMSRKLQEVKTNADSSKQREVEFHGTSISLHRAVRYWPMARIVILLIAGYLQVSHVVRFMRSKHIY
jgi:emp24/gp25L/p24 family/GOLD